MTEGKLGRIYSDGEVIFKEGDQGDRMYVIQSGKVKITKDSPLGDLEIAILEEGEIFGEMALFDRLTRSATATAVAETRALTIDKKMLFASISRDPSMVFKIIESMSRRMRALHENLKELKRDAVDAIHPWLSVNDLCSLLLDKAKKVISAENGSVMLIDDEEKTLKIMSAFGSHSDQKAELTPGKGIAGDVLRTGRAELVNNVSFDKRFIQGDMQIHSILCVPLKCRDTNYGVVNLSNSSEKLFAIDDLKILDSLSTYASICLKHAKTFANLKVSSEKVIWHASILDMP